MTNGEGVGQDQARAATLYGKACDGGHAEGCNNLARNYYLGEGVRKDDERALFYVRRALELDPDNEQAKNGLRVLTSQ